MTSPRAAASEDARGRARRCRRAAPARCAPIRAPSACAPPRRRPRTAGVRSRRLSLGQHVAGAVREPLRVFELPQLLGGAEIWTLESRADAEAPAGGEEAAPSKMPSPRLASVIGHSPATAPRRGDAARSRRAVMWVAWIRHQRASTASVVEQPLDRPRAGPGEAVLDLLHLLGDVDVDRPVAASARRSRRARRGVTARRLNAARRRRTASSRPRSPRAARLEQAGEAVEVVEEAALARRSAAAPPKPPWA